MKKEDKNVKVFVLVIQFISFVVVGGGNIDKLRYLECLIHQTSKCKDNCAAAIDKTAKIIYMVYKLALDGL